MKRTFFILTAFFALLSSSIPSLAYDCKVDNIYYNLNNEDKTASVTYMGLNSSDNKDAYVGNIIIPESTTYNGTTYSVTSIGKYAFSNCSRLTKLVSLAVEPPTCGIGAFIYVDKTSCQLLVPEESINKYKTADQWKDFLNILGYNGVDDVCVDTQDALYEVYNLQGVRIGSGMREEEVTADVLPHGVYILVSPQGRKKLKI